MSGVGLEGDRYCAKPATPAADRKPDREVTLIESEALEALDRECGIRLQPGEARRNLITRGVRLNDLVGQEFAVGEVVLRGMRLCNPCAHLESLTTAGVLSGLANRGGLRAQIVRGGRLRPGDAIRAPDSSIR